MIASLTGILTTIGKSEIIIEVNGVGYLLNVTSKLISTLGEIGSTLSVFKDLQIKDDKILMYGFTTVADQDFFRLLRNEGSTRVNLARYTLPFNCLRFSVS